MLSPAIAQTTGVNKSVSFARWQQGRGLLCLAPQLVVPVSVIVPVSRLETFSHGGLFGRCATVISEESKAELRRRYPHVKF